MIVFDSSTIILLTKIEILDAFLLNFPDRTLVSLKIKLEVEKGKREDTHLIAKLIKEKRIEVLRPKQINLIQKLMEDFNIDVGEAEALTLALQEKNCIIATDDRNAIKACKALRLDFVTAIAVLIRVFEKRLIDRNEALIRLKKLQSIGRYKETIIEDAMNQIRGGG
ncbi:MAG: hypothetical protein AB1797_00130 [bacterium]